MKLGEARVNQLVRQLLAESRFHDIERAVSDSKYQEKLFEEYEIK